MQGLIFHIRSFSVHDGPGIRQSIFLKGCPLRCPWCHNPESQEQEVETMLVHRKLGSSVYRFPEKVGRWMRVEDVMHYIIKDIPFFEESGGGVTLSGGEPLMQAGFSAALLAACMEHDIHTAVDTCGYAPLSELEKIIPFTRLFLYDLKLADEGAHLKYTGVSNAPILENLRHISQSGKSIIIRIPLVQDITDTEHNLLALRKIIERTPGIVRIDLLPYHPTGNHKYEHMGKCSAMSSAGSYSKQKAEELKELFNNSAPVVSIGG